MKKVELLCPVGNMKTLAFAIHNGADAVYFAGKKFGARKFANNFDEEEIVEAIKYCHLYGVKVYMTVNILVFDSEIAEALDYIAFLVEHNVDALIMQDIGLIRKVHELYPHLEIHISTQSHNHNDDGIAFFEKLGAKRVVLDREMSLDEIKNLKTNLEKEVFVHGALCVSYSGCCLFSSLNGGRSGNRGECVASCRLPYELYKNDQKVATNGKYLLSTRELNTIGRLSELIEAGITSFKIEGRMKSPEYVGFVTKLYRTMIDKYYAKEDMTVSDRDLYDLRKLYNRQFTEGYLFHQTGKNLMNIISPNHQGVKIGEVIACDRHHIKIRLMGDIRQEDGIRLPNGEGMMVNRLYDKNLLLVNAGVKDEIVYLDNKVNLHSKGPVLKTIDKNLNDSLQDFKERKIPIDMTITCHLGKPIRLCITDEKYTVEEESGIVESAVSSPTSQKRIIEQISKLGNTPFTIRKLDADIDPNIFVPIKELNELRRSTINTLISRRENETHDHHRKTVPEIKINKDKTIRLNVLVRNEEQLKICLEEKVDLIYTDDKKIYDKYKQNKNIYWRLPRVMMKHLKMTNEKLVATEVGSIWAHHQDNDLIADYTLNATNHETVVTLANSGVKFTTLSPEITTNHLDDINFINDNVEYIAYGTIELMIMKYCPIKMLDNDDRDNCNLCHLGNKYYLKDVNGAIYPIINTDHYTHIMHKEPIDNINNIKKCLTKGINNYRIELFDEKREEVKAIINRVRKELGD